MAASITELFTLNRQSSGRRRFTFKSTMKIAVRLDDTALVSFLEGALEHDRNTARLEARWRRVRGDRVSARGRSAEVGIELERVIGGMHRTVMGTFDALDPTSEHAAKLQAFIDRYFPEGVEGITNLDLEDILAIVEDMNVDFAALSTDEQAELNIAHHVPRLAALAPVLSTELNKTSPHMRFETVAAARAQGHENLCTLAALIIGRYHGLEPEKVAVRIELLEPLRAQDARVTERRKRRPAPDVEVDPETGEELEPGVFIDETDTDTDTNEDATA